MLIISKKQIAETEFLVELAKENQKYNHNNSFKNVIIKKVSQLLLVLKEGERVEEKSKGNKPNWKEIYHFYIGDKAPVDRI